MGFDAPVDIGLNDDHVAWFDHDVTGQQSHDVREEGLHLDIYRDGEKEDVLWNFPVVSLEDAPRYAEEYLKRHAEQFLQQFEQWHDLSRQ